MRLAAFALASLLAALSLAGCNPATKTDGDKPGLVVTDDADAGASGRGQAAEGGPAALLDPLSLQATWSFDRTCASADRMTLRADGAASYGEADEGMWAINEAGELVLILRRREPGADDDKGERKVLVLTASQAAGDDLVGQMAPGPDGDGPIAVNARRCAR